MLLLRGEQRKEKQRRKKREKEGNLTLARGGAGVSLTWARMYGLVEGIRIEKLHLPPGMVPKGLRQEGQ